MHRRGGRAGACGCRPGVSAGRAEDSRASCGGRRLGARARRATRGSPRGHRALRGSSRHPLGGAVDRALAGWHRGDPWTRQDHRDRLDGVEASRRSLEIRLAATHARRWITRGQDATAPVQDAVLLNAAGRRGRARARASISSSTSCGPTRIWWATPGAIASTLPCASCVAAGSRTCSSRAARGTASTRRSRSSRSPEPRLSRLPALTPTAAASARSGLSTTLRCTRFWPVRYCRPTVGRQ